MYYFYILKSDIDHGHYYGSTNNLKRRVSEHILGEVKSTKYRLPMKLVYYEAYETIEQARTREQQVKHSGSIRVALIKRISQKGASPASQREAGPVAQLVRASAS